MNESIQIFVRMRPLLPNEDEEAWIIHKDTDTIISIPRDPANTRRYADAFYNYSFSFDKLFSTNDSTDTVYQNSKQLIDYVLQGYNSTIFLYGQTTSGKTFTMLGDQQHPGILPFTLLDLFKDNQKSKTISYLEIYNEQINDLLQPGAINLKMADVNGTPVVYGLKQQPVDNFDDALSLLCFGEEQRCYREKQVHEHSSRSHTIFQVIVQHDGFTSALSLVDLAGSERLNAEDNSDETGYINKSLFVLSNVIHKLAEGKKSHIPFRDSKLTRYLQNSLGGNSFTSIICAISPASMNFYQTLSTLRFAQRAKKVQNKIVKSEGKISLIEQLQKEVQELRLEKETWTKQVKGQSQSQSQSQSEFYADQFLSYIQLQVNDKQQFTEDCQQAKHNYNKQIANLQLQFQQVIIQQSKLDVQPFENRIQFVNTFKDTISKQLEQETVFSNVYVNSILNPSVTTEFEQYDRDELYQVLTKAYQEASDALSLKFKDMVQNIQLIGQFLMKESCNITDENSLKLHNQQCQSEYNWMKYHQQLLQDQFTKKISILQKAYQNVQSNLIPSQRNSTVVNNLVNNLILPQSRQSTSTPKFTDRDQKLLYVWGSGKDGRLGTGNTMNQIVPCKINLANFTQVACGYYHSAAIHQDGGLFVWGKGYGETPCTLQPMIILNSVQQVACGWQHTLALLPNGQVFTWGLGEEGQLGLNSFESCGKPTRIEGLSEIQGIAAGHSHSAAIKSNKQLYMWGCNIDKRLMIDDTSNQNKPILIDILVSKVALGQNHSAVITIDGQIIMAGMGQNGQLGKQVQEPQTQVFLNLSAVDVACGEEMTLFLTKQGQVYSCGKKSNATLGHVMSQIPACLTEPKLVDGLKKIVQISVGKRHCLAVNQMRQLYGWGFNFYDQLGLGEKNRLIEIPMKLELEDVIQVACGEYHSLALSQA